LLVAEDFRTSFAVAPFSSEKPEGPRTALSVAGPLALVRHASRAAPRAPRLKIGIIVLADADSPLAQLDHPNLTRPNNASACGLADIVERAPVLERENALGFSPFGFAKRHEDLNREQRDCTQPCPVAGKTRTLRQGTAATVKIALPI
jgi:hypothetical protein